MLHNTVVSMFQPTASSVTNITTTLVSSHSFKVNCIIHPNSEADYCVVMAMADSGVFITGNAKICTYYVHLSLYVHTYIYI